MKYHAGCLELDRLLGSIQTRFWTKMILVFEHEHHLQL